MKASLIHTIILSQGEAPLPRDSGPGGSVQQAGQHHAGLAQRVQEQAAVQHARHLVPGGRSRTWQYTAG